jgi:AcrR family transcriptional regulator
MTSDSGSTPVGETRAVRAKTSLSADTRRIAPRAHAGSDQALDALSPLTCLLPAHTIQTTASLERHRAMEEEKKPNRNDRRRARTRELILDAADKVFRRKGVDNATVNDVTDEADVAYGSFYNHFVSMDEVVQARAELAMERVREHTEAILQHVDRVELLPCIGARVVMRALIGDPAIRWLLDRPYIFVDEAIKIGRPWMLAAEAEAVADGRLKPVGGHECWLRTFPWLLIAELREAIKVDDTLDHEERFALISLRFLGIDDVTAKSLIEESRALVGDVGVSAGADKAPAKGKRRATAG